MTHSPIQSIVLFLLSFLATSAVVHIYLCANGGGIAATATFATMRPNRSCRVWAKLTCTTNGKSLERILLTTLDSDDAIIGYKHYVTWCFQKNGNNGKCLPFSRNDAMQDRQTRSPRQRSKTRKSSRTYSPMLRRLSGLTSSVPIVSGKPS